jgi:hypothetical protein
MVKLLQGLPTQIKYSLLALGRRLVFRRLLLFPSLCQQHHYTAYIVDCYHFVIGGDNSSLIKVTAEEIIFLGLISCCSAFIE